ncbi:hypothetical protein [Pseudobacter ginsenosidimutans]|uniref:DUF2262 domain-containing protein n=1 Tax=Pseudobacter ginsenosidimutans TaxID=661488 RepID=A0A4V2F1Y8_9BACT|nr:hypothetical protein [Pseudobacter ginsenosidimutans]QEC43989.1 hypothetical protein FSB84_20765 [Pseudobacter ginsenosidimutans]RZS75426.1 hypothetical protein EV199_1292 [Pseudobacter ginsenosidimutans]
MSDFKNLQLEEELLRGNYTSAITGDITVQFDLEEEAPGLDDFKALVEEANAWIKTFTKESLEELKRQVAAELTDSAYGGSDYQPTAEDYNNLAEELTLKEIRFYPDEMYSLVLEAKKEYPDSLIYCQISTDFDIEDLIVSES